MKTKGAKICLGLLLLASWVLLVSNVSFAEDNDRFGGPFMKADYDKDGDWRQPNLPSNLFKPSEQPPQYDVRGSDQAQERRHYGRGNGNHYGWDKGKHHHQHPSSSR